MSCLLSSNWQDWLDQADLHNIVSTLGVSGSSFALIAVAELGDKSQLVCMTLAARYRAAPIILGATAAFALLNLLAVAFGAMVSRWIWPEATGLAVIVLFVAFGLRALFSGKEDENGAEVDSARHAVFLTSFLLIFAAEFGDKTQLAVAALSATLPPAPIWLGATAALAATSAVGVWAGRALLRRMPIYWLHRFSGILFLGFAAYAASQWEPGRFVGLMGH